MEDNTITVDENENPALSEQVSVDDSPLRNMIVDYVGHTLQPEGNIVNLEMVIEVLGSEFPELVLALAEENWVRGYQQALEDVENFENTSQT